jgi:hypothetical protein
VDFIEQLFGFSPDGGSGSFELMLLAIPVLGLLYLAATRAIKRRRRL